MSASSLLKRSRVRHEGREPSPASRRLEGLNSDMIPKPSGTRTVASKNGEAAFNPSLFLAKASLGRKVVNLEKGEQAYAQGDPADALFYVKRGRLRVTVNSSNGREATLAWWAPENLSVKAA
jgi:CRP-like cAMP-binding protein